MKPPAYLWRLRATRAFRWREHVFGGPSACRSDLYFLENPFYGTRRIPQGPSQITVRYHWTKVK